MEYYKLIYVDITAECNMNCPLCYQKGNEMRDVVTPEYFEEVCKRLSKRAFIRFIGGEPTVSPYLFDFIDIAKKYRHIPTIVTNGLKLLDQDYAKKLIETGVPIALSLNSLDHRMTAFHNLVRLGCTSIVTLTVVLKDTNEYMIPFLLRLAKEHGDDRYIEVHFRNQYPAGEGWDEKKNIPFEDLKNMILSQVDIVRHDKYCHGKCCWKGRTKNYRIKISDGSGQDVLDCKDRGKLLNDFKMEPFLRRVRDDYSEEKNKD